MTGTPEKRTVASCSYRDVSDCGGSASCQLLADVSGVADQSLLTVEPDACEACCDSFFPTPHDWNPVIASLLHRVASEAKRLGGVHGCSQVNAERLAEAAIKNLPTVLPHEDDVVDDVQHFAVPQQLTQQQLAELLPVPPTLTFGNSIEWAIGITTAPRRQPTLTTCLETIIASGWETFHLFVDGDVEFDDKFSGMPQTRRPEPIGAWPAWCDALRILLTEYPDANTIAIVQDDALFPAIASFRSYVEQLLWPESAPCIVSLYTSADDTLEQNEWRRYPDVWKFGAVAFVLPRSVAEDMLQNIDAGDLEFLQGTAGIDTRIGVWADRMKVPIWHPSPSLVQHIGQVSSIWKRSRAVGLRRASRFLNDEL